MHANELIKRIVAGIHHHTEAEREAMLAAVDLAFPVDPPKPAPVELPEGGLDMETKAKLGMLPGDEGQAPGVVLGPGVTNLVFSDSKDPAGA